MIIQKEKNAGGDNGHTFIGLGSRELPVPGFVKVDHVFIDGIPIPETIDRPFRERKSGAETSEVHTIEFPAWQLIGEGVDAVLLRSEFSNDGIWQAKSQIRLIGERQEIEESDEGDDQSEPNVPDSDTEPADAPAMSLELNGGQVKLNGKRLDRMKIDLIISVADRLGIRDLSGTKAAIVQRIKSEISK